MSAPRLLDIEHLTAGYGPVQVLRDVSLHVDEGEAVALDGALSGRATTDSVRPRRLPLHTSRVAATSP